MTFPALDPSELLVLGVLYTLLALLSPKAALFAILPVIALAPETRVGLVVMRPDDMMFAILAICWGLRRLMSSVRGATPLDQPLVWYVIVGLAATLWGAAIGTADLTSLAKTSASGLHLLKRLEFVLYFFMLKDTIRSITDARRFLYVFMASLAALSLHSLGSFQQSGMIALAPTGAPVHEPGLASMLNVALALGFMVGSGGIGRSWLMNAVLLGSLYTLPFGLGRNYLSATLMMLLIVAIWRKRSVLILLAMGVVVIALAGVTLYPQKVTERYLTLVSALAGAPEAGAQGVSLVDRFRPAVEHGWEVLTSSPLLGWGLGSIALGSIDSEYAGQFVYTGILGFLVFAWVVRRIVRTARETYRAARDRGSPALPLVAGLQHCLLGYALYSLFSPSISAARAGAFFFTIVGLVGVLHREVVMADVREGAPEDEAVEFRAAPLGVPAREWTA